ncbi:hypothetical protein PRZ61_12340 [Halomonas pacifica]|uniref:hypothetical protein n=1 Tax=Bisbaumannia pacifica TaxID=77098 RepID=UPI002359A814|nr:hypothetical protein [Halomonas pacifica]MDC8804231.1 hypothetical protein [Halomonas pacifica]
MSRRLWLMTVIGFAMMAVLDLGGCARTEPLPEPPPLPPPIVCAAPVAMTAQDPAPLAPHGTDSQREVALYLLALHRWGVQGWQRLAAIRDYTERCHEGTEERANPTDAED